MVYKFFLGCFLWGVTLWGRSTWAHPGEGENHIVMRLGGKGISTMDVKQRMALTMFLTGYEPKPQDYGRFYQKMLYQRAKEMFKLQKIQKLGIQVSEREIQQAIARLEKSRGAEPGSLIPKLRERGVSPRIFKDFIASRLVWGSYITKKYEDLLSIPEARIDAAIERESQERKKKKLFLAEIVFFYRNATQKEGALMQAQGVLSLLRQGAQFTRVAEEFSESPSKERQGVLGWMGEEDMPQALWRKVGQSSKETLLGPLVFPGHVAIVAVIDTREPDYNFKAKYPRALAKEQLIQEKIERYSEKELREVAACLSRNPTPRKGPRGDSKSPGSLKSDA